MPWLAEIEFSTLEKVNGSYVTDDLRNVSMTLLHLSL